MVNSRKLLVSFFIISAVGVTVLSRQVSDFGSGAKLVQPVELAKELSNVKSAKPTILYVGPQFLYQGGHIPGAVFHGQAARLDGLRELKQWAQDLPRTQPIVIYCGCCPWDRCPNVRPAFKTLNEMGFKQLRVLQIPADFETDWVRKGYPVER
ncbi:MAG: rhodanese-like domain-containing protein [Acidobacteria bacterium]|nr:rhodanese-like domain-containing protein [Acidobacteriota bacterium]